MTCIPKKNEKIRSRAFFMTAGGVLLWMMTSLGFPGAVFLQLAAVALLVVGLQYLIRYELSDYRYVLEDTDEGDCDLLIFKAQGKRDTKVAHIELSKVKTIFKLEALAEYQSKYGRTTNRYNYCQKPGKEHVWVLLWRDGDDFVEVRFEPDDAFVKAIEARIKPWSLIDEDE